MSVIGSNILAGSAGSGGEGALYVDDVFSTYLYNGTGAAQTITNGINLSGKGGMVWTKCRSLSEAHMVFDTERGVQKRLFTNVYNAESTSSNTLTAFNSNGFTIGDNNIFNTNNSTNCAWTFRKAPGFFDVVSWSGNNTAGRVIPHNLGSAPGMVIIKSTSSTYEWVVWHRELANSEYLYLNTTAAKASSDNYFNNTTPDASGITLSDSGHVNGTGETYVAYVFAHNDQSFGTDEDEPIIKCGTYEGNGGTKQINLTFEFQWLLIKNVDSASDAYGNADWTIVDNMREASTEKSRLLYSNLTNAEGNGGRIVPTPTGFKIDNESNIDYNASGDTYIYVAIRRPHKPPEAGTDVFAIDTFTGSTPNYVSDFPVDLFITRDSINSTADNDLGVRLAGANLLRTNSNLYESSSSTTVFDYPNGHSNGSGSADSTNYSWMFKRAPGFMDVVIADYPGSSQAVPHGLGVAPELIISKPRTGFIGWMVGSDYLPNTSGWNRYMQLEVNVAEGGTTTVWNQTAPTTTHFTLGSYPGSSYEGVFILFATLAGVSKVGSYSGSAGSVSVDCGFSSGARFVLIKRTDDQADWYVWDSVRGINGGSGTDPYFRLNLTDGQVTPFDYITPLDAGFIVNSNAPAALNDSNGTYLFLAIA